MFNFLTSSLKKELHESLFQNINPTDPHLCDFKCNLKCFKKQFLCLFTLDSIEKNKSNELLFELLNDLAPDYERNYKKLDIRDVDYSLIKEMDHHKYVLWVYIEKYLKESYKDQIKNIVIEENRLRKIRIKNGMVGFKKHPFMSVKNLLKGEVRL